MNISGKKILITGGAGFIGSATGRALIELGGQVCVIDNLVTGSRKNLDSRMEFYELNMSSPVLQEVFEKERPEIIYHFASNVRVPESVKDPSLEMDGIMGSVQLLGLAVQYEVKKFIFASSGFLYGNAANLPISEHAPIELISPYAIAKYAVENFLTFYHRTHNLPGVIFRYATVYGPGQVMGAMADYIRKLRNDEQAEIWGDGTKTRDYVYIDDVVRANLAALDLPAEYPNPLFNIGTGQETSLNELYTFIAKALKREAHPVYLPDRLGELMRYALDCNKAKQALNWQPTILIEEGVRRVIVQSL